MKDKNIEKKKRPLQEKWLLYLFINNIMLFPPVFGFFTTDHLPMVGELTHRMPEFCSDISGIWLLSFMMVAMFYWCFRLHYVHIVLEPIFLIFFAVKLFKEKNIKMFLLILLLTVISIVLNLFWSVYGEYPMGV